MALNSSLKSAALLIFASSIAACATTPGMAENEPVADNAQRTAATATVTSAPDYSDGANWLCLPGRDDACAANIDAAVIAPDGSVEVETFTRAENPPVDCFYVYPTVSRDQTDNADMNAGPEELSVIAAQFARYGSQCRTFAPLYRQVTLTYLMNNPPAGGDLRRAALSAEIRETAYADVKRAWEDYLANRNEGRGVILVGHSQGSSVLKRLIAEEIESSDIHSQIISAHLIGFNVSVPEGERVGGDFQQMPLCVGASQTGCVVAYSAFAEDTPPAPRTLFARSYEDGREIACVHPGAPGTPARHPLEAYFSNTPETQVEGAWVDGKAIPQRFVKLPGMVTGQCVGKDGADYLEITFKDDDKRQQPPLGPTASNPATAGLWGLHVLDVHLGMGDLVELAGRQSAAYLAGE